MDEAGKSVYKYSLVSAENKGALARGLKPKLEVFNTIQAMTNVGWTENALRALDEWMRMRKRWNKRASGEVVDLGWKELRTIT